MKVAGTPEETVVRNKQISHIIHSLQNQLRKEENNEWNPLLAMTAFVGLFTPEYHS